jgi:hypothetical protein
MKMTEREDSPEGTFSAALCWRHQSVVARLRVEPARGCSCRRSLTWDEHGAALQSARTGAEGQSGDPDGQAEGGEDDASERWKSPDGPSAPVTQGGIGEGLDAPLPGEGTAGSEEQMRDWSVAVNQAEADRLCTAPTVSLASKSRTVGGPARSARISGKPEKILSCCQQANALIDRVSWVTATISPQKRRRVPVSRR